MFKIHLLGSESKLFVDKQMITRSFIPLFYQRGLAWNLLTSQTVQLKHLLDADGYNESVFLFFLQASFSGGHVRS
jgi:hypothetical protein